MFKNIKNISILSAVLLGVSCSSSVDFSEFTAGYDKAIQKTTEQNLLLNIVRSSRNQPLHFTSISGVSGSTDFDVGSVNIFSPFNQLFSWSRAEVGASGTLNTPNFTQTSSVGVSPLNTSEFLSGLLAQLSPTTISFYTAQGIPKELLLHLVIDSVEISTSQSTTKIENNPAGTDYDEFKDLLLSLVELGITTETVETLSKMGPILTEEEASDPARTELAYSSGLVMIQVKGSMPPRFQMYKPASYSRFCFASSDVKEEGLPESVMCSLGGLDAGSISGSGDLATGRALGQDENISIKFVTRSARGIFEYLGRLVFLQNRASNPISVELKSPEAVNYNYQNNGSQLFVVNKNQGQGKEFLSVNYRGDNYSIPKKGQGYTTSVLAITLDILNLSKTVNSLPPPTTVRLN